MLGIFCPAQPEDWVLRSWGNDDQRLVKGCRYDQR